MPVLRSHTRSRSFALAIIAGAALSLVGVVGAADAASPFGAVSHSGFTTTQSASIMSVDFDYVGDPLFDGSITLTYNSYIDCSTLSANQIVVIPIPAGSTGHYSNTFALATNNRSQIQLDQTDGTTSQFSEVGYPADPAAPYSLAAVITPNADPTTGDVALTAGADHWTTQYQLEIDGVATTAFPSTFFNCLGVGTTYAGLAAGSTLDVVSMQGAPAVLASFTRPATAGGGPAPAAPGTALASTGTDAAPLLVASGSLLVIGISAMVGVGRRRRSLRAQ
jgi:hypothetical protein